MGIPNVPWYGEDLASCIEASKKLIAKIESGDRSKETLEQFIEVNSEIIKYASAC